MEAIPGTTVKFEMVPVRPGAFTPAPQSGGRPPRPVRMKAFWIARTETTWEAYDIFAFRLDLSEDDRIAGVDAESRPSKPYGAPDEGFGHQGYPALRATYHSATEFCRWLSKKTGRNYRLPTEVEWEYACRAGAKEWRLSPSELNEAAWYAENSDAQTHPVGTKRANRWGLHDMLGNVAEWCAAPDGKSVVRGGSYRDEATEVHGAARAFQTPAWQIRDSQRPKSQWWLSDGPFVGFRIVRDAAGQESASGRQTK